MRAEWIAPEAGACLEWSPQFGQAFLDRMNECQVAMTFGTGDSTIFDGLITAFSPDLPRVELRSRIARKYRAPNPYIQSS
jgi:hypothetical protein